MDLKIFLRAELEKNPLLEEEEFIEDRPDEDEFELDKEFSSLTDEEIENQNSPEEDRENLKILPSGLRKKGGRD